MHSKSLALAAAFAFALSGVTAEPSRPRIYYPRQVKRQVANASEPDTTATKRDPQLLDDLLGGLLGDGDSTETPKSTTPSKDEPSDSGILIGPTGIVVPGLIGDDDDNNGGGNGGNGGTNGTATATGTKDEDSSTRPKATAEPTSTKGGLRDPIVDPLPTLISDVLGPSKTSTSKTPSGTSSAGNGDDNNNTKTGDDSKTQSNEPEPTREPTSTKGGLLDPIVDPLPTLISEVLPGPSSSKTTAPGSTGGAGNGTDPEPTSSSPGNIVTEILPSLTLFPPEPSSSTKSDPPSEPSDTPPSGTSSPPVIPTDILPTVSLPPILPDPTDTTSLPGSTDGPGNGTTIPTDVPTDIPTNVPTSGPTGVPTPIPTPDPTPGESTSIVLPPPPPQNETSAVPPPESATTPTVLPTLTETPAPTTPNPPQTPTSAPEPSSVSEEPSRPPPSETIIPTSQPPKPPVTSIEPTATFTNSDDWMPSTIVADPTSFTYVPPTGTKTGTSSTGLPTDIPKVILPNNPKTKKPDGTREIQIGFKYPMNYKHVAKNPVAAAQIFMYLPKALSFAGEFNIDKVEVFELNPEDTEDKWGYITTIAKIHYPETLIDKLQTDLWEPLSDLYNHPDALVRDLTVDINPDIDIFGNITDDDDNVDDKPEDNDNGSNDALDSGNDNNNSAKESATKAGIAVGAFGLAALYGGAMFIVARRYKRKKQGHRRTSSVSGSEVSSEMQYTGNGSPAMMGGALMSQDMSSYGGVGNRERDSNGSGPSARTANISAPVATENSLGWN